MQPSDYVVVKHKICEECGTTFFHEAAKSERYCPEHRKLAIPTIVPAGKRSAFRMKQYAWSELPKFLSESKAVH